MKSNKCFLIVCLIVVPFSLYGGEKNVSTFVGIYTGYTQSTDTVYVSSYNYHGYEDFTYKNIMLGFSTRFGISDKVSENVTLYYLGLFEAGLYMNVGESNLYRSFGEVNFGAEIKCLYKKYLFGMALGTLNISMLFARPSVGYRVTNNSLLELFFDYQLPYGFDKAFNGFKIGVSMSLFK
jgi:hypothetical protein